MKTAEEVKKMIEELEERHSSSSNMGYERGGAIQALEWVLNKEKYLNTGIRR